MLQNVLNVLLGTVRCEERLSLSLGSCLAVGIGRELEMGRLSAEPARNR